MSFSWGRVVAGVLFIILGIGWLLEAAGIADFPLRALLPVALIVVGAGLAVGSRWGSYPGLIAIGVALTLVLTISPERNDDRFDDGNFGERVYQPQSDGELRPYRVTAGQLTIDLTELDLELVTYDVEASVGVGQLVVIVPQGIPFRVESSTGIGNIDVLGEDRSSGFGPDDTYESNGYEGTRPRISLELRSWIGSIEVRSRPLRGSFDLQERVG